MPDQHANQSVVPAPQKQHYRPLCIYYTATVECYRDRRTGEPPTEEASSGVIEYS